MQPQILYATLQAQRSFNLHELLPDPVAPAGVQQRLAAANWAPSHGHTDKVKW
jgi:hypothetical protein